MKKLLGLILIFPMLLVACGDNISYEDANTSIKEAIRERDDYTSQSQNYSKEEFGDINTTTLLDSDIYMMTPNDGDINKLSSIIIIELEDKEYLKDYEEFFEKTQERDFICTTGTIIIAAKGDVAIEIVEDLC